MINLLHFGNCRLGIHLADSITSRYNSILLPKRIEFDFDEELQHVDYI